MVTRRRAFIRSRSTLMYVLFSEDTLLVTFGIDEERLYIRRKQQDDTLHFRKINLVIRRFVPRGACVAL